MQTNRALCIATERSFIEVQYQLKVLHFLHNEFEKTIFKSTKIPKMVLFREWGQFWKGTYVKVCRAIPHSKGVRTRFSYNFHFRCGHPYVQSPLKCKNIGTLKIFALHT